MLGADPLNVGVLRLPDSSFSSTRRRSLHAKGDETVEQVAAGTRLTPAVIRGIEMGRVGLQDWKLVAISGHFGIPIEELTA